MSQGVSSFSNTRLHYQKPRSTADLGFKWTRGAGAEDEMPPLNAFSPTPARAETRSLADGSPVCITGLSGQKHLNGCKGTLVGKDESRLLVELSSGPEAGAIKALKPQNVELDVRGAPATSPPIRSTPVVSSPTLARPFDVGSRVRLVGLETRPELNKRTGVIVEKQGTRYHVRLDGEDPQDKLMKAKNLESVALDKGTAPKPPPVTPPAPAMAPAPPRPPSSERERPRPPPKLRDLLQAAKPTWADKDLSAVMEKLAKAQVTNFTDLREALYSTGPSALNERLRSAGQKIFATETVAALKAQVDLQEPPKPKIESNPDLPVQHWEVIKLAVVREAPSPGARAVARKDPGEVLEGVEETFNGFLKLRLGGWCPKEAETGQLVRRVGAVPLLAADFLSTPGPQPFEVAFQPSVAVRSAPSTTANIISARRFGEVVMAETQTYHGWLRLADDGGWMLSLPIGLQERRNTCMAGCLKWSDSQRYACFHGRPTSSAWHSPSTSLPGSHVNVAASGASSARARGRLSQRGTTQEAGRRAKKGGPKKRGRAESGEKKRRATTRRASKTRG
ncbi:unnamed protein product [Effrenium voratum]|uniref:Uncharacterized protein n=1 Tax=Effrenium voratum TaxID=2562239 RepID=A0AA36I7F8_9DINO|nr:unnamed protein product [Effrenium voratum]